ncbi:hypothetical protein ACX818_001397 [Acinetobacter baumannii]
MDVLSEYQESKKALDEISKKLFNMFEENDKFKIIANSGVSYLDFSDHKEDHTKVIINLYTYSDVSPRVSFECNRASALSCDENTVEMWLDASIKIIEIANMAKAKKFLKDFPSTDHALIHLVMAIADKIPDQTDSKIAEFAAKQYTKILKDKLK